MKIVRVTYTSKADYAAQNQDNIKKVMADLRQLDHPGIFYHVCMGADGKTFTHTAFLIQHANDHEYRNRFIYDCTIARLQ